MQIHRLLQDSRNIDQCFSDMISHFSRERALHPVLFTGDETVQLLRFCTVASGPGNLGMDCLDKIPLFHKSSV